MGYFMRRKTKKRLRNIALILIAIAIIDYLIDHYLPISGRPVTMEVTAYCACKKCCGWKRNWLWRPVYSSGPLKGKRKKVGLCADGSKAAYGTIAADTPYYRFGTRMFIPGYGRGSVHDTGKAIKGANRIDIFFPSHSQALRWGRRQLQVIVAD